jgi:hypothetical protein
VVLLLLAARRIVILPTDRVRICWCPFQLVSGDDIGFKVTHVHKGTVTVLQEHARHKTPVATGECVVPGVGTCNVHFDNKYDSAGRSIVLPRRQNYNSECFCLYSRTVHLGIPADRPPPPLPGTRG